MNNDEIQALREKHQPMPAYWPKYCAGCATEQYWQGVAYPCDVIKVLDAYEAQTNAIKQELSLGHHDAAELRDAVLHIINQ